MRISNRRVSAAACLLAAAGLVASACGSSSSSATNKSSSSNSTAASAPSTSAQSPSPASLVPASLKAKGTILFGAPEQNPPMLYLNSKTQQLEGVNYGLGEAIGKELGLKVQFVNTPFASLIPGLDAGKFDAILDSMDDLPAREKLLTFVDYAKDGAVLIVHAGNPKKITTLSTLCGKTLALLQGSVQVGLTQTASTKCTSAGKPAIQTAQFSQVGDALLAVQSGRDDAFFASVGAALYHQKVQPSIFAYPPGTKIYAPTMIGAAVPKSDQQLAQALQAAIKALIANGTYQKVFSSNGYGPGELTSSQITINGGGNYSATATEPFGG